MSDFEKIEAEFEELTVDLKQRIGALTAIADSQKRLQEIKSLELDFTEGEKILKEMSLAAKTAGSSMEYQSRISEHRATLTKLRKDLQTASLSASTSANRESLFEGVTVDDLSTSTDQRTALLEATKLMERGGQRIDAMEQELVSTIQVGRDTMTMLSEQGDKLKQARGRLGGINNQLNKAKKIMIGMKRRITQNKFLVAIIILVLLALIFLIIYFKWFYNSSSSSSSSGSNNKHSGTTTSTSGVQITLATT